MMPLLQNWKIPGQGLPGTDALRLGQCIVCSEHGGICNLGASSCLLAASCHVVERHLGAALVHRQQQTCSASAHQFSVLMTHKVILTCILIKILSSTGQRRGVAFKAETYGVLLLLHCMLIYL